MSESTTMLLKCGRCRARIEFGTDGNGNLTEHEIRCRCPPEPVKRRPVVKRKPGKRRICVDCPADISERHHRSIRCLPCAKAADKRSTKEWQQAERAKQPSCMNPECENPRKSEAKWCLPCSNALAKTARRENAKKAYQPRKRATIRNQGSSA